VNFRFIALTLAKSAVKVWKAQMPENWKRCAIKLWLNRGIPVSALLSIV